MHTKKLLQISAFTFLGLQACSHIQDTQKIVRTSGAKQEWVQEVTKREAMTSPLIPQLPTAGEKITPQKRNVAADESISDDLLPDDPASATKKYTPPAKLAAALKARSAAVSYRQRLSPAFRVAFPNIKKLNFSGDRAARFAAAADRKATAAKRAKTPKVDLKWKTDNRSLKFAGADYKNNLSQRFTTYYAAPGTTKIRVDFASIDLETGYDKLLIYDQSGICATYSGTFTDFKSTQCYGDYVDIWVETDASNEGASFDGVQIQSFETTSDFDDDTHWSPIAYARANKYSAVNGERIYFDGSSSYDPDGSYFDLSFYWTFGDGSYSTYDSLWKTYAYPGTYYVELDVEDEDYLTDYDYFYMHISQAPPVATFTLKSTLLSTSNPELLYPVANNQAATYYIDWGDNTSTTISPYRAQTGLSHSYSVAGNYVIVAKATNSAGVDVYSQSIQVSGQEIPPAIYLANEAAMNKTFGKVYAFSPCIQLSDDGSVTNASVDWGITDTLNQPASFAINSGTCRAGGTKATSLKHTYQKTMPNGRPGNLAGAFYVTVSATDNTAAVGQKSFPVVTKNVAPKNYDRDPFVAIKIVCAKQR